MHLEVIRDPSRWRSLVPEWRTLAEQCEHTTPFQLPEWLLPWWAHFGSGELVVLAFWEQDRLVGLAPFFLHQWDGRRQVTLIGSGISDYLEPMMLPQRKNKILEQLRDYLQHRSDWDICFWQDLNHDTPLALLGELRPDTPSSVILFDWFEKSFDEYWSARGPNLRRNVRRYGHRAHSTGPVEFAVSSAAEPSLIDALLQLHGARWRAHGQSGMVATNNSDSFLRDSACAFARHNILRIFSLHIRAEIAAIILAFELRGRMYGYLTGFDPAVEHFGPGRLLLHHTLRHCFAQGCTGWDFLRGEEAYKADWGAEPVLKSRVVLERK